MLSIFYLYSAKKRWIEIEKTIAALGGESEAPFQILAQRDYILKEIEYYTESSNTFAFYSIIFLLTIGLGCVIIYH